MDKVIHVDRVEFIDSGEKQSVSTPRAWIEGRVRRIRWHIDALAAELASHEADLKAMDGLAAKR